MEDSTSGDEVVDGIDRRSLLAGAAGVGGAVALAGCAEEEDDEGDSEEDESSQYAVERRPRLPDDPGSLNQPDRYIIESLDFQNRLLEEIHREVS